MSLPTNHSNASDYTPEWLKGLGVKSGRWYQSAKARPEQLMKISLSPEAAKVYACLELHTMGYKQELAIKMLKGGRMVPLTPTDIAQETGLSKQHVRRALEELEEKGLAERRPIAGNDLTKGNVAIYSWAVPRPPKEQNGSHPRLPFPDWFSQSLEPLRALIQRYKYELPKDLEAIRGSLSALEEAARVLQTAEKGACEILDRVCAGAAHIRKKEKESIEEKIPPPQPSVVSSNGHPKAEEEEPRSENRTEPTLTPPEPPQTPPPEPHPEKKQDLYEQFKSSYPKDHYDEGKAKPLFRGLKPAAQQRAVDRLRDVYLTCERWQDQDGRWIPFASTFLQNDYYDTEPPPPIRKHHASGSDERILKMMRGET